MTHYHKEKSFSKNKAYNIQLSSWDSWLLYEYFDISIKLFGEYEYFQFYISLFRIFEFDLYYTRKKDHAGIGIDISLTNKLNFIAYTYDKRHWDDEANDWCNHD